MTHEEYVSRMNETLVGQEGITTHEFEGNQAEAPKNIGSFVKAEAKGCNVLITFSKELVLLFTPLSLISIVGENEGGGYPCKDICSNLFIGGKSLGKVLQEIDPS